MANGLEEIRWWSEHPITQSVLKKLDIQFNAHTALLGAELGTSVDRLKGRAEVLEQLRHVQELFE